MSQKNNLILAFESSCDETSVAVIENGSIIRSNIVASQIKSHMRFGGVVPEVASRHHVEQITQIYQLALKKAQVSIDEIDAIAVTKGPGLVGALLIGITAAKTLAFVHDKPLIEVSHLAGHIYACQLENQLQFPLLALIASGGHTELVYMKNHNQFEVIGETQDDAVGEAYDKVGRILDLPYPAGKYLDQLAQTGQATYPVPRAMIHEDNLDFSFSGMKSAIMNLVYNAQQRGETIVKEDLATSFQTAVIDVLTTKAAKAVAKYPSVKQFILAGGVAANSGLRKELVATLDPIEVLIPSLPLCGDNAAMIGAAAYQMYQQQQIGSLDFNAQPSLDLS